MQILKIAASARHYLNHMESYNSPMEYYHCGTEPDGKWWNPADLFDLEDDDDIEPATFQELHAGLSPVERKPLTRNANYKNRVPGIEITFSPDKSYSALWAIAEPALRERLEAAHSRAVRCALDTVTRRYCAYTRVGIGGYNVVPGDIFAANFPHHVSRTNDPLLHTRCVLFNLVRTHLDGKWRTLYQLPVFQWKRAGGAVYRNALAWYARNEIGLRLEPYGDDREFLRVPGFPQALLRAWSKRRAAIDKLAAERGTTPGARPAFADRLAQATRTPIDALLPNERHDLFRAQAAQYLDPDTFIAELFDDSESSPAPEDFTDLTARCLDIPPRLTRDRDAFTLPQLLEHVARQSAGCAAPTALEGIASAVLDDSAVALVADRHAGNTADIAAGLAHTHLYAPVDRQCAGVPSP